MAARVGANYPIINPPAVPAGTISVFPAEIGYREFELAINHAPFGREAVEPIAREMLVWGGIDPNCDTRIEALEANSRWMPYQNRMKLVASAGVGTKTINVKLRNDTGTSAAMTGTMTVADIPHASILWTAYKRGTTLVGWSPSHACAQYHVALHYDDRPVYPDRVDITNGGALTAGQYMETTVPLQPATKSRYVVLIIQIYVASTLRWWPDSVTL